MPVCKQCNSTTTRKWYKGGTQCRNCYRKSIYTYKGRPHSVKRCDACDVEFEDATFGQIGRYCSRSCSEKSRRVYKVFDNTCLECGISFLRNRKINYCSNRCYTKMHKRTVPITVTERLKKNLRSRLNQCLANSSDASATRLAGCSITELKAHLESMFSPEMSWDNYGKTGWHIDHVRPLADFNLADPEQVKVACHYSNLQPLWAVENLSKGARCE